MTSTSIQDNDNSPQSKLYALGSNGSGQLGIGHVEDASSPQPVIGSEEVLTAGDSHIACGGNHTMILFGDGKIATTGDNSDGRCLTTAENRARHVAHALITADEIRDISQEILHIAATWTSTLLVSSKGQLFTCGTGNYGELGLGKGVETARKPTAMEGFPPPDSAIVKVASCMGHYVAVLSNGEVWGWGKGRKGQLGQPAENVWKPRRIEGIDCFVVDAVCGKDFTCVFGSPSTGELLVLGPSSNDRFGVKANAPRKVSPWKQIAASWGSVFILSESGQVTAWGRNDHRQLPPPDLPPLASIAAGSEHCLGLTRTGEVLAWGWGEHGNCGQDTDSDGDVKGRWNKIEMSQSVSAVFAGCATSFIVTN